MLLTTATAVDFAAKPGASALASRVAPPFEELSAAPFAAAPSVVMGGGATAAVRGAWDAPSVAGVAFPPAPLAPSTPSARGTIDTCRVLPARATPISNSPCGDL